MEEEKLQAILEEMNLLLEKEEEKELQKLGTASPVVAGSAIPVGTPVRMRNGRVEPAELGDVVVGIVMSVDPATGNAVVATQSRNGEVVQTTSFPTARGPRLLKLPEAGELSRVKDVGDLQRFASRHGWASESELLEAVEEFDRSGRLGVFGSNYSYMVSGRGGSLETIVERAAKIQKEGAAQPASQIDLQKEELRLEGISGT